MGWLFGTREIEANWGLGLRWLEDRGHGRAVGETRHLSHPVYVYLRWLQVRWRSSATQVPEDVLGLRGFWFTRSFWHLVLIMLRNLWPRWIIRINLFDNIFNISTVPSSILLFRFSVFKWGKFVLQSPFRFLILPGTEQSIQVFIHLWLLVFLLSFSIYALNVLYCALLVIVWSTIRKSYLIFKHVECIHSHPGWVTVFIGFLTGCDIWNAGLFVFVWVIVSVAFLGGFLI